MDKKHTDTILRNPQVLRALVSEIDTDPGELVHEGYGHRLVAERPDDTPMADIYLAANGGVYIIAYSIGPGNPKHLALYGWASKIGHKVISHLEEHNTRIITITEDSIEITGRPAVHNLTVHVNEQTTFLRRVDASSPAIGELLAILRGEDIIPVTELGRLAKEVLEG